MLEIEKHRDLIREIMLEGTFYDHEDEEVPASPDLFGLSEERLQELVQELQLSEDSELFFYLKHCAPRFRCMWDAALGSYGLLFWSEEELKPVPEGLLFSDDMDLAFEHPTKQGVSGVVVFYDNTPYRAANTIEQFFRMLRYSWVLMDSEEHQQAGELDLDDVDGLVQHFRKMAQLIDQVVPGCALPWLKSMSSWDIEEHWDQIKPGS